MEDESFLKILSRGKYLIVVTVAVTVALALVLTSHQQKIYEATAILQVDTPTDPGTGADPLNAQQASQGLATTYATLIVDRGFLTAIAPTIGDGRSSVSTIQGKLHARAIPLTALVELAGRGDSPAAAESLANAVAKAFVWKVERDLLARAAEQQSLLHSQIDTISSEIAKLNTQGSSANGSSRERLKSLQQARAALSTQLARAIASGLQAGGRASLTSPATAKANPVSPRPVLNAAAALLLGLLVGFALAWLRVRVDRKVHTAAEAEQLLGAPLLASVPLRRRSPRPDTILAEAFDVLHANLAFHSLDRNLGVLIVTSYGQREGKSTTVEGLAFAAARAGEPVVAIDGDLRTRGLSKRLGHGDAPGLSNVLIGAESAADCFVDLAPNLSFLPAGPAPRNAPGLLGSEEMKDLLAQFRADEVLVVVDAPPVANLADAPILAAVSDGIVVVARTGVTQRTQLRAVAADLRHTPVPIVGLVVLEPRHVASRYVRPRHVPDVVA